MYIHLDLYKSSSEVTMNSSLPAIAKPKLGISACLLGNEVRYNGGHKESRLCSRTLN